MSSAIDFIVIGAQKSASTFVQSCLADHPEIWMPCRETPYFEDPDYDLSRGDYFAKLFAGRREPILGIKRPNYLGRPEVAQRIHNDAPNAKLIATLRNPMERVISAYFHYARGGFIPALPFDEGMSRILDDPDFSIRYPRAYEIVEFSRYFKNLQRYAYFKERKQLLIILHEDVATKPVETARALYDYLGASVDHSVSVLKKRPQSVVYNMTRLRGLHRVALLANRYNVDHTRYLGARNPVARLLSITYKRFDRHILEQLFPNQKPKVDDALMCRLLHLFADDIKSLEHYLGRDLAAWRQWWQPC